MGTRKGPSVVVCTLPCVSEVVSGTSEMRTLLVPWIWAPCPPPLWSAGLAAADGEEAPAADAGEFPKLRPSVSFFLSLFLFEKIFLLNPAAPYKEGPVLSHSPPLQLD